MDEGGKKPAVKTSFINLQLEINVKDEDESNKLEKLSSHASDPHLGLNPTFSHSNIGNTKDPRKDSASHLHKKL